MSTEELRLASDVCLRRKHVGRQGHVLGQVDNSPDTDFLKSTVKLKTRCAMMTAQSWDQVRAVSGWGYLSLYG